MGPYSSRSGSRYDLGSMGMIAYRLVRDDLMLFIAGNGAPSESEWSDYILALTKASNQLRPHNRPLRFICFVDDSQTSPKQRAQVMEALGGLQSKTAVVTTSKFARHVITVFSWLGLTVKGYAPNDLEAVAEYLDLPPAFLEQAVDAARALAPSVGGVRSFQEVERARGLA
jgi:hypothetical protein